MLHFRPYIVKTKVVISEGIPHMLHCHNASVWSIEVPHSCETYRESSTPKFWHFVKYTNHHKKVTGKWYYKIQLEIYPALHKHLLSQNTLPREGCFLKRLSHKSGRFIHPQRWKFQYKNAINMKNEAT